jgi:hypothetical protein
MAMYCQNMLELALVLAAHDPTYEDLAIKFYEHFALIGSARNHKGLWDETDSFYTTSCTSRAARRSRWAPARSSGCCRSRR